MSNIKPTLLLFATAIIVTSFTIVSSKTDQEVILNKLDQLIRLVKQVDPRFDVLYSDHLKIIKTQEEKFHEKILEKIEFISLKLDTINEKNLERTNQIETNMMQLNQSFHIKINQENKLLQAHLDKLTNMHLLNSEKQNEYMISLNKSLTSNLDNLQLINSTENKLEKILNENLNRTEKKLYEIESEIKIVSNELPKQELIHSHISNEINQQNDQISLFMNRTENKLEDLQTYLIQTNDLSEKNIFEQIDLLSLMLNSSDQTLKKMQTNLNEYNNRTLKKFENVSIEMKQLFHMNRIDENEEMANYSNHIIRQLDNLTKSLMIKHNFEAKQLFENILIQFNRTYSQNNLNEINNNKSIVDILQQLELLNSRLEKSLNNSNLEHKSLVLQLAAFNERKVKLFKINETNFHNFTTDSSLTEISSTQKRFAFKFKQQLKEHKNAVSSLAVLKDGSIASGSYDTTIAIWNAMNGSLLRKLKGHSKCITCLAALNLNGMLASGSWDTTLMIWNQTNGRLMHVLRGHDDSVYTLAVLSEERLASGSRDFTIIIWNYTTKADSIARGEFRLAHRLRGHTHFVIALTVFRDISIGQLISGSYDETIKIWNPNSGDLIRNLKVCNGPVLSLIPISDSQLAVGTTKEIKILNLQNGQQLKKFTEKSENVYSMVLLEANILVSSSVQRIVFRNLTNGEIIKRVDTAHNGVILCLALLSEQNLLASGSQDNSVKLWNTREIND